MASSKEEIEGTVKKTWSKDEAKFVTIKYLLQTSGRSKLVALRTIQITGLLKTKQFVPTIKKNPCAGFCVNINFQLLWVNKKDLNCLR